MSKRAYSSPLRAAAAAETRARLVDAAGQLLAGTGRASAVTMEAVAKASGVTRLTVYKQFGARRALLEAVFDELARTGGLDRIAGAMAMADPRIALHRLVEVFCAFWADVPAIGRLYDAAADDPEFALALAERNERRRKAIGVLVARLGARRGRLTIADVTDLLFGMTSLAMYRTLSQGRTKTQVAILLKQACDGILDETAPVDQAD